MGDFFFFGQSRGVFDASRGDQDAEFLVENGQFFFGQRSGQSQHQLVVHVAGGLVHPVERSDFFHGFFGRRHNSVQTGVFWADPSFFEQGTLGEIFPTLPKIAVLAFDQDHRNNGALAGLDEHEGFKDFIHGAKAAGEIPRWPRHGQRTSTSE